MWRFLRLSFTAIIVGLLTACENREQASTPQIVYAGLGISNHLEVGMSLKQIGKNNNDLKVTRSWKPDAWPWEKLFKKPQSFYAKVPSRGAMVWGFNDAQTFGELKFTMPELPPTLLCIGTNEIALSKTQSVSFHELVRRLGQPRYTLEKATDRTFPGLINAGQPTLLSNGDSRVLYYPARGVFFHFRQDYLLEFDITRRFADTNIAASSN
jgi:hypothetical protein